MILVDANLLLHAYNPRSVQHARAKAWFEATLSGTRPVRFAWVTIWAFLRITTHARIFEHPLSFEEAAGHVSSWFAQPCVGLLEPGDHHWETLTTAASAGQASGPLVMDAALAALAIEHGATLQTTDRDFARFTGLKWADPLAASKS